VRPGGSKRFGPSKRAEYLIPLVLVCLLVGLLATLVVVFLAVLGLTPGM
jgi:hypothetical protein